MKSSTRSVRLTIVPALVAAFALSACQDAAPTAAPPSSPAATAEATQAPTEESTEPSEESSAPETSESSESTEAAPSSDSGEPKEECESTQSYRIEREDVKPGNAGSTQNVDAEYGDGELAITPGKMSVDTSAGDDYFPGEGNQTIIIPVTMEAKGGSHVVSDLGFSVSDAADEVCQKDSSTVISRSEGIQVETLKDGDKITGKLAFAVPTGADLSKYTLNYTSDYSSGEADVAWKVK